MWSKYFLKLRSNQSMNIVIEGVDASGKSMLARFLSRKLARPLVLSEGPEKFPGEINDRISRIFGYQDVVFDRHPCVSHGVYHRFAPNMVDADHDLIVQFFDSRPLFIWCRGPKALTDDNHQLKAHDTAEHLNQITKNHEEITAIYEAWALDFAHISYRIGDSMDQVYRMAKGAVS
jgi:hypothetical protein